MGIAQIIAIACLPLLAIMIIRIPELGIALCVVISLFLKETIQPLIQPIDATIFFFAITYSSIIIRCSMEKMLVLPDNKINLCVLFLLSLLVASLFYTPLPDRGTETIFLFVSVNISIMYATLIWCRNTDRLKRLLFLFALISLVYGTVTFIRVFVFGYELSERALLTSQTAAIKVGQLLASGILVAIVLNNVVHNRIKKITLTLLTVMGAIELIALNTRAPLIGFVIAGVCLFLLYPRKEKKRFTFYCGILLAVFGFAFFLLPSQYTQRYDLAMILQSGSLADRLDMWGFVGRRFSDWFLAGAGISGFGYYHSYADPHSMFLDVFAHAGFFALAAFVWLIWQLLYRGIKAARTQNDSLRPLGIAATIALISFIVSGLFSTSLAETRALWFFAGIILCLERLLRYDHPETVRS